MFERGFRLFRGFEKGRESWRTHIVFFGPTKKRTYAGKQPLKQVRELKQAELHLSCAAQCGYRAGGNILQASIPANVFFFLGGGVAS